MLRHFALHWGRTNPGETLANHTRLARRHHPRVAHRPPNTAIILEFLLKMPQILRNCRALAVKHLTPTAITLAVALLLTASGMVGLRLHARQEKPAVETASPPPTAGTADTTADKVVNTTKNSQPNANPADIALDGQQWLAVLTHQEQELRRGLTPNNALDREKTTLLEAELAEIQRRQKNPALALKQIESKLGQASQALDEAKADIDPALLERAAKALRQGETEGAENLFLALRTQAMAKTAKAVYQLAQLEESRIDFANAYRHAKEAADLQPDNRAYLDYAASISQALKHEGETEVFRQRSLALLEKNLGPDHPQLAAGLFDMAEWHYAQGQYDKAGPLAARALAIREKALGPDHPEVAASLNLSASIYEAQSAYAQAEPLYRRSLAILEKSLGPEHPEVATGLNNLAGLYRIQGAYDLALPLYQKSLDLRKKALGPNHPDVAQSLNNLAALYRAEGAYAKAEPLYQRSLAILEQSFGPDHPLVATCLNNLAALYAAQGAYAKAAPLYQRTLGIWEKTHGPDHPLLATGMNNLAAIYDTQGDYAQAEALYLRSLALREKILGPGHPDVATVLNNLAGLYKAQGLYAKAEPLYQRSLAIIEQSLGPKHPELATTLTNYADLLRKLDRGAKADATLARAKAIPARH